MVGQRKPGLLLWLVLPVAMVCAGEPCGGQQAGTAAKQDKAVGHYSLVTTVTESSGAAHWLNPPLTLAVEGGTERVPSDAAGTKTIPAQYALEGFGTPRWDCVPAVPRLHGCEALDRTDVTILDANTVGYHLVSHGGAVQLNLNLQVHDVQPVSRGSAETEWRPGQVIFVAVPKATPAYHFVSEVLVGDWNGQAIVFEVGKPLPEAAKKGLEDLGTRQDLGDRVLYSFRVKDPGQAK